MIDAVYTNAFTVKKKKVVATDGNVESSNLPEETFLKFSTRKTGKKRLGVQLIPLVLYENILMQAPDGQVLCSIGNKV